MAVFLVFTYEVSGQTSRSYKFRFDGSLPADNVITTDKSVIINYRISELEASELINSTGSFFRVSIPGHIRTSEPGKPELPVLSRLISMQQETGFSIKISNVRSERIKPSGKKIEGILYPAQESETKGAQQRREFKIDKALYARRGTIPGDTVRIEYLGMARNQKLASLFISPVRYNPHTNTMEVITSMKIEITFTNAKGSLPAEKSLFAESLDKGVLSFNPDQVVPGFSDQPVKMIILTDSSFSKQLAPFIKWKTQKGFRIKVLYRGATLAGDDYAHLKSTINDIFSASTQSDPAPDYLLIIGDVKRIPTYTSEGNGNVTDMYYGEFTGNGDYIPDMFIGRLPVADTTELRTVVSKILQYEKFQFADTNKFYTRAMATAGFDDGYANYMNGQLKYAVTNYLTPANQINEYHFNYPQSFTSKDSIMNVINNGVSFINYTGHGDEAGWLHVNIKTPDIALMKNKYMYPFIISNACRTSQYNTVTSFGPRMVLAADKGAIGFIGCSNDSYWDEDFYWAVGPGVISSNPTYAGSGLGAYDRLFHSHGESPSEWYYTMGQVNFSGNLAVSASTSSRKKYYWETYNLVGDPSLIPFIGKPGNFSFNLPDTLPNGIRSLTLTGDPFAYIGVSHADTLVDATFTSWSGGAVIDLPGLSNDSCLVVITGQNKLPVIKTVYFSKINKEFLNLTSVTVNDITGNNNTLADYGETFFLKLDLSNLGLSDSQNLYAKVSTASDLVTINSDSVYIGTMLAGSNLIIPDKLSVTVSKSVPDLGTATFDLILKDQKTEKHYKIDICIHAPDPEIVNCVLNDNTTGNGDDIADPGETFNLVFKIQNNGSSNISGQFNISSSDNHITIMEPGVKSGILESGKVIEIPVQVKLSQNVPSGSLINVSALLDCNPIIVNKDFSFRVGKIRESFEASSFKVFPWINISAVPWVISPYTSYDGGLSARSGAISHNESTSLIIRSVYTDEDSLRFYYRVSSETNYDVLSLRLNGVEVFKSSGEISWTRAAVAVPAGQNTFEWIYRKDNSVSEGSDCAWIDMIDFAEKTTVSYISRDLKTARIVTPANGKKYGHETLTVRVLNVGRDTINGFKLAYKLNDSQKAVTETFASTVLPYGDSVTVAFNSKIDMTKYGYYRIAVYGVDNNDEYLNNDTITTNIENVLVVNSVSVFPNPFTDRITVIVNSPAYDVINISLSSISGVKVFETRKEILQGINSITFENLKLAPAVYYLNIHGAATDKTVSVIRIKN